MGVRGKHWFQDSSGIQRSADAQYLLCDLGVYEMGFELAPVEGLDDDQLKEMANLFAEKCQKAAQQTIRDAAIAGNALNVMKKRVAHGEWVAWLGANFDYSRQTASAYMTLASNVKRFTFEPTSIREALRLISEQPSEATESPIVPRSERKTGRVEVQKPGQQAVQPDEPEAKPEREKDDDPNQAPKTNTKHSAATTKAKEADRKPPAPITPEIIEEPKADPVQQWIQSHSLSDLIGAVIDNLDGDKAKRKAAKELRKMADTLDPPTVGAPNLEAVQEWAASRGLKDFDSEKFFAHYALADWKYGKAKTPIKDWKLAAINAYGRGAGWAVDGSNRLPF